VNYFFTLFGGLALLVIGSVRADVSSEILNINQSLYLDPHSEQTLNHGSVYVPEFVGIFYELIEFQPAWQDKDYIKEMIVLIGYSYKEGLNPDDYHYSELMALLEEYQKGWADQDYVRAQFDVLLTDGILLYARHLLEGKVNPRMLDESWNYSRRDFVPEKVAQALVEAIRTRQVAVVIDGLNPAAPVYQQMKKELAYYRELAQSEQFFTVPTDVVLKPGQTGPSVLLLRRRLKQLSYIELNGPESEYFDAQLKESVIKLQSDHSIDADGIVGKQSFAVLNMTFKQRVSRLRVNMDRLRWIREDISDDFILVNIAGYELQYFRDRKPVWETSVMTGTIDTQTPIFHKRLKYVEFNPTWTPPRSIINRSLFAKFKANPDYAVRKNYAFYDSSGKSVDPHSINWSSYTGLNFPYRVVQMPGPENAMGQVKFMFPNRHAVYLHDTPSKQLFSRTSRAFSAGCIRVQHPLELASILLDDQKRWSKQQVQNLVDSGKPQQIVTVDRDIDVLLMYWTVSPTTTGRMQFHPDIYELDDLALAALDAPVQVSDAHRY
jgi:murein L,D-transpeptidase YcbB/YkuD